MSKERRHYDIEFKTMAIELAMNRDNNTEVAKELGIAPDLIRRWRREFSANESGSFPGRGNINLTAEEKEIYELKKKLRDTELERDILKKVVGIFSKSDGTSSGS